MWACSAPAPAAAAATDPGSSAADPVVPRPSAPFEPGLARSLARAGARREASEAVAALLSAESRRLSAAIAREARARASSGGKGKEKEKEKERDVVAVAVHKHSLDLCAAAASPSFSTSKEFIKISRPAYCRLLRAFRECGPEAERPPELGSCTAAAADADADDAEVAAAATTPTSSSSSSSPHPRAAFHSRLFAMLLRYRSLSGPGFHASVGGPVCAVLAKTLGTGLEGFASPVNARWARFGCAFADVDAVFGGLGSFFTAAAEGKGVSGGGGRLAANKLLLPAGGAVLVNPPFEPGLLLAAARCCVRAVEEASQKGTRLSVVFVGPRWGKKKGEGEEEDGGGGNGGGGNGGAPDPNAYLSVLSSAAPSSSSSSSSSSSCLEHSFFVAAAEHGYRDGAPHAARDPYRRSPFDSAVFLLRSAAEREKRPLRDLEGWERQVREAFGLCVPSAEAEERQRAARGATDRKGWGAAAAAAAGGEEAAGEGKKKVSSSLRASIEARQRLKAEKRKKGKGSGGGNNAHHPGLSPSGKRWVKKSKMNAGKRKEGGGGGGGGGEAKKQKK